MERSQTVSIAGRPSWSWAVACVAKEPSRDIIGGLIDDEGLARVLVCMGMAPALEGPPPPTPRRPLTDLVRFAADTADPSVHEPVTAAR